MVAKLKVLTATAMGLILLPSLSNAIVGGYTQYTTYGNSPGTFSYPVQGGNEPANPYAPNTSLASSYDQSPVTPPGPGTAVTPATTPISNITSVTASPTSGNEESSGVPSISGNAAAATKILHPEKDKDKKSNCGDGTAYIVPEPMCDEDVRHRLVIRSIREAQLRTGECACPYNLNSEGFECGLESAYYRPGGWRLRCYPQDFRGQEYIFYRKTLQ